jgi:hypothetical protein
MNDVIQEVVNSIQERACRILIFDYAVNFHDELKEARRRANWIEIEMERHNIAMHPKLMTELDYATAIWKWTKNYQQTHLYTYNRRISDLMQVALDDDEYLKSDKRILFERNHSRELYFIYIYFIKEHTYNRIHAYSPEELLVIPFDIMKKIVDNWIRKVYPDE